MIIHIVCFMSQKIELDLSISIKKLTEINLRSQTN